MINIVQAKIYRNDIDGLRAIAVLAVILFHFGYLPNGFLGVDIFFVISGFLITGIIYNELSTGRFSIGKFYLRRIRRIIPLTLFVSLIALTIGIITMLPDDLENLAESVIATNLLSNNILQAITTKNYWDVVNEYKPLMHTWSLAVEEHYYLLYPFLFLFVGKKRISWLLPIISTVAIVSLALYLLPYSQEYQKFYLIYFRFWELAAGGIAAIALSNKLIQYKYSGSAALFLVLLLCFNVPFLSHELTLVATTLLSLGIIVASNQAGSISSMILENKLLVGIGKISFSLYMWHQVLLAYARYFWVQELHTIHLTVLFVLTLIFSVLSYYLIEQPFRDKNRIATKTLLWVVAFVFVSTVGASFYIYLEAGVIRNVPELGITKSSVERNMHAQYNSRIYSYDNPFIPTGRIKVLVIGNSFARDWANVLLESKYANQLEISYVPSVEDHQDFRVRVEQADVIFFSTPERMDIEKYGLPETKLWALGTKNFGSSNGIFYNYRGNDYYNQRTLMIDGYIDENQRLLNEWGNRYIDYIRKVIDDTGQVPVFTPQHQFISQDCRHFTKAGAQYFAQLFEEELAPIFSSTGKLKMSTK